ncbi:unnamed protein product [Lota lota]
MIAGLITLDSLSFAGLVSTQTGSDGGLEAPPDQRAVRVTGAAGWGTFRGQSSGIALNFYCLLVPFMGNSARRSRSLAGEVEKKMAAAVGKRRSGVDPAAGSQVSWRLTDVASLHCENNGRKLISHQSVQATSDVCRRHRRSALVQGATAGPASCGTVNETKTHRGKALV